MADDERRAKIFEENRVAEAELREAVQELRATGVEASKRVNLIRTEYRVRRRATRGG